jgi:hypothetical protein
MATALSTGHRFYLHRYRAFPHLPIRISTPQTITDFSMIPLTQNTLTQFKNVLSEIPEELYTERCQQLSNASIGQHARHIIELFQCLMHGYHVGVISYDKRERNLRIESEVKFALNCIDTIIENLDQPNHELIIEMNLGETTQVASNYYREIMYNLEHTIHHEALIRVAIESLSTYELPKSFGVAPSTLKFRAACAQ